MYYIYMNITVGLNIVSHSDINKVYVYILEYLFKKHSKCIYTGILYIIITVGITIEIYLTCYSV